MRSINKQPKQIGYIFSVYKNDGDRHTNLVDHLNMITHLKLNSIPHQEVELPLQVSRGFYLQVDENNTKEELDNFIKSQCSYASQDHYYLITEERNVIKIDLSGERQGIGKLTAVDKQVALSRTFCVYCPAIETYYVIEGGA